MGNWGFIFRQLVLDCFQTLFYFVPQEKNITVKLQLVAIVSSHCRGSELAKKIICNSFENECIPNWWIVMMSSDDV